MMKLINRNIPLDHLTLSPMNVRTVTAHPDDEEELQASIAALGVLESLLVRPADGDGTYHVVGGGRRLSVLQRLAESKTIRRDYAVPCRVLPDSASPRERAGGGNVPTGIGLRPGCESTG